MKILMIECNKEELLANKRVEDCIIDTFQAFADNLVRTSNLSFSGLVESEGDNSETDSIQNRNAD